MSNETRWTPGPWEVHMHGTRSESNFGQREYPCVHSPEPRASGSNVICAFYDSRENPDEATANARLIAAAPEMAELLERLAQSQEIIAIARIREESSALLAKIKGAENPAALR